MDLSEKNRRVHTRIADLYASFVECLLGLNRAGAHAAWEEFRRTLNKHADLEESEVLPSAESLSIIGKGDPRIIRHDHRLLEQALGNVAELLKELETLAEDEWIPRLARSLETLARFEQIFEHHTVRECDFLYAALQERVDEETRDNIHAILERSL